MTLEQFKKLSVGDKVSLTELNGDGAHWETAAVIHKKHSRSATIKIGKDLLVRNYKQLNIE